MKMPKKNWQIFLVLICNFIILFGIYMVGVNYAPIPTMAIYTAILAVTAFGYVIYNRGFSRKNVTIDMLPDDWPPEKKTEFIEDAQRRFESSKWVLLILLPLIGIFAYEIIDIYIISKWL